MSCSTAKVSLSNYSPIIYPESFPLCKKAVYNGLSLELYTLFDFQIRRYSISLSSFNLKVSSVGW